MDQDKVRRALEQITARDPEHVLRPQAVVDAARAPGHPLHPYFTWDNPRAAEQYRLDQARRLIQHVYVVNVEAMQPGPIPVYVSLMEDRAHPGGGYRRLEEVLANAPQREALRRMALRELQSWTQRYMMLTDLVERVSQAAGFAPTAVCDTAATTPPPRRKKKKP